MKARTVVFVFAGRRANMELQLPFIRRILDAHPDVEYHVWDCAIEESDHEWLKTITGERITVWDDFYDPPQWWCAHNRVYRYYTHSYYQGCRFVKIDDDVVFLQDRNFGDFVEAIDANPGAVVSARVINNGAGTNAELRQRISCPLGEVHRDVDYAMMCHQYMFDNWREMVGQTWPELVPVRDWLSINVVGYTYQMICKIAELAGDHPPVDAWSNVENIPREITANATMADGRLFADLGDEGIVNLFPRLIFQSFLACHLYFGPQRDLMSHGDIDDLRKRYAEVGKLYRESV